MKLTFLLPIGVVLSTFFISCQKKSDNSTPTPDYRQNVTGTYYNAQTIININTIEAYSQYTALTLTTLPSFFSVNTIVSLGSFGSQFKISSDPSDATKAEFTDTNSTNPTTLFYANSFKETSPITTFYIPSQSPSSSILSSVNSLTGISSLFSSSFVTISIQGSETYSFNGISYDGYYNSGNNIITAYATGVLNLNLGILSKSFNIFTLTITGTKK